MVELIKDRDQLEEQSTLPTGMSWMVQALSALPATKQSSEPKRFANHGVIKPGSTTDKVFRFLQKHPTRWYRLSQIAVGAGCRDKTVSWALHQLKEQGLVEAVTLSRQANSRYLRYCITRDRATT
jgi:hypothetical protein